MAASPTSTICDNRSSRDAGAPAEIPAAAPPKSYPSCTHGDPGTLFNLERGIAFRADCGSRARCEAARRRWYREMRERLELVEYYRTPDLWTFTTRTADQDAAYRTARATLKARLYHRTAGLAGEPLDLRDTDGIDRGAPTRDNIDIMNRAITALLRRVERQVQRQRQPGYKDTRHALKLHRVYGTAFPVRGRPGAALHIRVREAGELNGRLHCHIASDFDFLLHAWLEHTAIACGLGHIQYERRLTNDLRRCARSSGPRVRAAAIAHYLTAYLTTDAGAPWPWPRRTRLVSAGMHRKLPPRPSKPGWLYTTRALCHVAIDELGAIAIDVDATFYAATPRDPRPTPASGGAHPPPT